VQKALGSQENQLTPTMVETFRPDADQGCHTPRRACHLEGDLELVNVNVVKARREPRLLVSIDDVGEAQALEVFGAVALLNVIEWLWPDKRYMIYKRAMGQEGAHHSSVLHKDINDRTPRLDAEAWLGCASRFHC
jgi:hypothetical protein